MDAVADREQRLLLLDSASMYFRAFFGVPEVTADDGTPVNAVRGFLDFISRLVVEYRPSHLVCAWDNDWRPQWRVDLIPSYKGHRVVAERASAPARFSIPVCSSVPTRAWETIAFSTPTLSFTTGAPLVTALCFRHAR